MCPSKTDTLNLLPAAAKGFALLGKEGAFSVGWKIFESAGNVEKRDCARDSTRDNSRDEGQPAQSLMIAISQGNRGKVQHISPR